MAIGSGTSATSVCCRCNDHGTCQRCSCVKAGRFCVNCLPLKRGHCANANPSSSNSLNNANPQSSNTHCSTPASTSISYLPRESSVPVLSTSLSDSQVPLEDTGSLATNDQCALHSDSITTPLGISPLHFIPPFEPVNTSDFSC